MNLSFDALSSAHSLRRCPDEDEHPLFFSNAGFKSNLSNYRRRFNYRSSEPAEKNTDFETEKDPL